MKKQDDYLVSEGALYVANTNKDGEVISPYRQFSCLDQLYINEEKLEGLSKRFKGILKDFKYNKSLNYLLSEYHTPIKQKKKKKINKNISRKDAKRFRKLTQETHQESDYRIMQKILFCYQYFVGDHYNNIKALEDLSYYFGFRNDIFDNDVLYNNLAESFNRARKIKEF